MHTSQNDNPQQVFTPIYVTPKNCELALGVKWRWARETALELGVPIIRRGAKTLIVAAPLVEALRAAAEREAAARAPKTDEDERDQMRAQLGLVRR